MFRDLHEETVRNWKEDIDTLLVFTGLFSAIETAFLVAIYPSLKQDSGDATVAMLFQRSQQLNSFSVSPSFINSTQVAVPSSDSFQPPFIVVRINVLWFVSVLPSLATAALSMLVKQLLREYMTTDHVGDAERYRLRHFRREGLRQWRVYEIAAALPQLLQLALVIFLIGLPDFAETLNAILGWIVTGLLAVFLSFYICVHHVGASVRYFLPLRVTYVERYPGLFPALKYRVLELLLRARGRTQSLYKILITPSSQRYPLQALTDI